jgi:hypothetical protein
MLLILKARRSESPGNLSPESEFEALDLDQLVST